MRAARQAAFYGAALALLHGCATTPPPSPDELVWIGVTGDDRCIVKVESRRFTLPRGEARLRAHLEGLAGRSQGALMGGEDEAPSYRCWTFALFVVQRVGFRRLGFVSAPSEASDAEKKSADD
jgi:hypothetical protein